MVNKMHNSSLKGSLSRSLFILVGLLLAMTVEASHFRFGHFTWEARPDISAETADFRMTVAFRSSAFGHPDIGQTFRPGTFDFGDGARVNYYFEVIARNLQEDWIVGRAIQSGQESGTVRHTYPAVNNNGNPWQANFSSCCKIGSLRNAANASWRVITQVNLENGNSSPFSNLPPIVTCSKFDCRFRIPAVDPDGDPLTWRMATRSESAIPSIPSGMNVDTNTGVLTWAGSDTFTNGLYSVQVVIEDRDQDNNIKSNTAIDFIINLQDQGANAWPEFDIPPTPESGTVITAVVGQPLTINVQATDPDPNDVVFLNHVGLPIGATFEQTVSGGVTGVAALQWIPTTNDMGKHIVTFLANDNRGGASTPIAITIDVIKPAISNVRVVSTISTADIQIDSSTYSVPPSQISVEGERTVVTWEFPSFNVGQIENLNTTLRLYNLQPGEQRVVTEKLEVFYTDIDGQPVYEMLNEQQVKVAPTLTRVSVGTDKQLYLPGEFVTVTSSLENLSNIPADATVVLDIVDSQQNLVTSLGTFSETAITPLGNVSLPDAFFDTAGIYAGAYVAVAKLVEEGKVIQQATAPFSIATENGDFVNIGALVNTDKPLYQAWDQSIISLRVSNLTQNAAFNGGQGELRVLKPNGELIAQQSYTLNSLTPQSNSDRQYVLPLVDREAGTYQVQWTVSQNGATLASSSATFVVERSDVASLIGSVIVNSYPTGEAQSCYFETGNRSAITPTTATLIYQLVNIDTSELVYEIRESDVAVSNSENHPYQLLLNDAPAYGGYGCILMAEVDGELTQLAAVGFKVTPSKLNVSLDLAGRGKLLVLVDDKETIAARDTNLAEAQRLYLDQLLTSNNWNYTLVDNQVDFIKEFYSGVYSAIVLFSEKVSLTTEVEKLLVEAQHRGVGLLISGSWNRRNSQLERALGITVKGINTGTVAINLVEGAVINPVATDALVPQGLSLTRCQADVWAEFAYGKRNNDDDHDERDNHDDLDKHQGDCKSDNDHDSEDSHDKHDSDDKHSNDCNEHDNCTTPIAVSVAAYGKGNNAYFAYDVLDLATNSQGLNEQLLLQALSYIQPEVWPVGSEHVIPVNLSIENFSRKAAVDVYLSLPQGGSIIESQIPLQLVDGKWLWQRDFSSPDNASNVLYIQLPEGVSGDIYLIADVNAGLNRSLIVDSQELMFKLATLPAESFYQRMLLLIEQLQLSGTGAARYDFVLNRINKTQLKVNKGKYDEAIHTLLQASKEIAKEVSELAVETRLVISEWLYQLQKLSLSMPVDEVEGKNEDKNEDENEHKK